MEKKTKNSSQGTGKGLLIVCLKILIAIILFALLIAFGWIAGIIWFVLFRKKMSSDPDKQKKYTIGIATASVLSFIIFVYSMVTAPVNPTSLFLSSTIESQELDVDNDYIIKVDFAPEDASLSSVRYNVDRTSLATITTDPQDPSSLILHTKREGTITITAQKGEIKSNELSFNIVDRERIEREKAKEEERLAAEASKAEEEQLAAASTESPSSDSNTTNSTMVWVDDTAKRYHKKNGCGMDNAYQVTLEEAIRMGKTPCGRCY